MSSSSSFSYNYEDTEDHIEVLHAEADPLEVAEVAGGEVDQAAGAGLQEDGLSVRNTLTNNNLTLEEIEFNTYTEA